MKVSPASFDGQSIRRVYDEATETWWFSVIDVVQVLTESKSAKRYWSDLKRKLAQEAGSGQPYEEIVQLKLTATDGKQRETDCAKAATLLRIVQSIPSPKAEPIKLWLAKVGYERMQEMADPALSLNRARQTWQQHGRSDKWIQQRMTGQETRNKLTDYWREHDIKAGQEFAILTNIIHTEWSGVSVKDHKAVKGLSSHNLRDHMTEAELIFTALAELSTRQIAETMNASGLPENTTAAKAGGGIAKQARKQLESQTGKSVVSGQNYLAPKAAKAIKAPK
ncbi:Bro-N domain-containing protein [Polaromonas sp.]|uniref:BRO-N domain-containing protein n=1 Tax=Polaromonas sp. TaxID=1869339 RepID=UPI0024883C61|nr:Bro-N domain-containing protein [Polaromonas sp.]MDI1271960.1 Bro-N domain-containing protein [Polaromonas sp.]